MAFSNIKKAFSFKIIPSTQVLEKKREVRISNLVAMLGQGNIRLQQGKYLTENDINEIRSKVSKYEF